MRKDATPATTPRLVLGLVIVAVGVLFTLDNLGLAEADDLLRYWPVILIVLGAARLWSGFQRARGVLWIALGAVLLLPAVSNEIEFQDLVDRWPLFLIGFGVYTVWRSFAGGRRPGDRTPADRPGVSRAEMEHPGVPPVPPAGDRQPGAPSPAGEPATHPTASVFSFLSSVKRTVEGPGFRRGEATALLGGAELDLRGAQLDPGGAVIEVLALWGGIVVRVPDRWRVELQANVLMGAAEDNTRRSAGVRTADVRRRGRRGDEEAETEDAGGAARLAVRGFVLMGGIEVKS